MKNVNRSSEFRLIVGLRLDCSATQYYLGFEPASTGAGRFSNVRLMIEDHLEELEQQARALRFILESDDPEEAARFLQDGVRLQVSEVVLRPTPSRDRLVSALQGALPGDTRP